MSIQISQLPDLPDVGVEVICAGRQVRCSVCGATALNTSRDRNRFAKRHPGKCTERAAFTKQLASGTKSVDECTGADRRGGIDGGMEDYQS